MATALEAAFPLNSNWPAATVRSKLAEAMIAVFDTPNLSGEDFSIQPYPAIAVYGPDGDLTLYAFDATDTVTADDGGVSCIVVSGRRYKRVGEMVVKDAAISATTTAQPVSPSLGDTYIVPAAPSGDDWASQAKTVATFTARGWIFRQPFVGMMVYVADQDAIYHYDSNGDWIEGLPVGAIQDGSIPPKKLEHPFAILKVVDERNAPPGSPPSIGTMYQVGTSPTGAFVGHDREIAVWAGSAYEFLVPVEGDTIYRIDQDALYTHRSGVWEVTVISSPVINVYYSGPATDQNFSNVAGPQTIEVIDDIVGEPGNVWKLTLHESKFYYTRFGGNPVAFDIGVYIDSESTPRAIIHAGGSDYGNYMIGGETNNDSSPLTRSAFTAVIFVPDASPHSVGIKVRRTSGSSNEVNGVASAAFFIEEIRLS